MGPGDLGDRDPVPREGGRVSPEGRAPRIALFTHDTFGLGHVRRCLRIVTRLAEEAPGAAILFVTGSPALSVCGALPAHADVVKIPTLVRTGAKAGRPSHLPLPLDELTRLRQGLIREAVLTFAPDVFLVDNFPLGSRRELLPVLTDLRKTGARTVLGLRDILDAPDVVQRDWTRQGVYDALERLYDRILVYGVREVMDLTQAYALPPAVAAKIRYCGYVTDQPRTGSPPPETSRTPDLPERFLLATGGGGGDGLPMLRSFLEALALLPPTPALVLTGPLMSGRDRETLRERASQLPDVRFLDFVPDLPRLLPLAEVVVSMCGYNTVTEIAAHRARAVVIPRTWRYGEHERGDAAGIEWEQLLRARAMARLGLIDLVEPDVLTPKLLAERIRARRAAEVPAGNGLDLGGLDVVTRHVLALASKNDGVAHGRT